MQQKSRPCCHVGLAKIIRLDKVSLWWVVRVNRKPWLVAKKAGDCDGCWSIRPVVWLQQLDEIVSEADWEGTSSHQARRSLLPLYSSRSDIRAVESRTIRTAKYVAWIKCFAGELSQFKACMGVRTLIWIILKRGGTMWPDRFICFCTFPYKKRHFVPVHLVPKSVGVIIVKPVLTRSTSRNRNSDLHYVWSYFAVLSLINVTLSIRCLWLWL